MLGIGWAGLYRGVGAGHLVALCAVAALPAAASMVPRLRGPLVAAAAVAAVPLALGLAMRRSLWDLVTLEHGAWAAARAIVPDGVRAGGHTGLPVAPVEQPALVALLDVALVALAAAAAWQILVRRRPVAGLVAVGVGLAYRWTVLPPGGATATGVAALAGLTGVLALATWEGGGAGRAARRAAGALALGAVAAMVAAGLGAGPAKAGEPWWAWRTWDLGGGAATSGAALDLRQSYGKLDWPARPQVALEVSSPRALPLRAVTLNEFDGIAFTLVEDTQTGQDSRRLSVAGGRIAVGDLEGGDGPEITQRVTLVGASTQVLLASGRPQRVDGPFTGTADLIGGAIRVDTALSPGDSYTVRTRVPQPSPADLARAPAYDPARIPRGSTEMRPGYWRTPVDVPVWGSHDAGPSDAQLGPYARVRALARRVAGGARTPYAAVNRIESYLRRSYVYDEQPPAPTSPPADASVGWSASDPPLVDFLFHSHRGFCQHFAGSMAVMLRSLGIPARVAVGYTGGHFDAGRGDWVVLDRDAHSWVEVWFPGRGWLPFDPTPGRASPNPASVSSPDYAPTRFEIRLTGIERSAVAPPPPAPGPAPAPPAPAPESRARTGATPAGGGIAWQWALLGLVAPAFTAPAARALRRARGRRRGDERARVVAAAREFEASLRALGWAPSSAASPSERAAAVHRRTGVDPSPLYRRASQARFGPGPLPAGAGAAAWRELARLRRAVTRRAPLGRRLRAAVGLGGARRGTVDR